MSKRNQKTIFFVLILFLPLSILESIQTYEDDRIYNTTSELPLKGLNHIYSTPERSNTIKKVLYLSDSLKNNGYTIGYYGGARHIFEFYTNDYLLKNSGFRQSTNDSIRFKENFKDIDKMAIFLLFGYPSDEVKIDRNTVLLKQLDELNFSISRKENLILAIKDNH